MKKPISSATVVPRQFLLEKLLTVLCTAAVFMPSQLLIIKHCNDEENEPLKMIAKLYMANNLEQLNPFQLTWNVAKQLNPFQLTWNVAKQLNPFQLTWNVAKQSTRTTASRLVFGFFFEICL